MSYSTHPKKSLKKKNKSSGLIEIPFKFFLFTPVERRRHHRYTVPSLNYDLSVWGKNGRYYF